MHRQAMTENKLDAVVDIEEQPAPTRTCNSACVLHALTVKEVHNSQKLVEDESHDEVDGMEASPSTHPCHQQKSTPIRSR